MKKPLPSLKTPTYTCTLPLTNTKIKFRPYNVADEKILIQAVASKDDPEFYTNNILQVVQGSILNDDVDLKKLPSIEVRYLMLQQRAKSVGEVIEFTIDGKETEADIDSFIIVNPRTDYKIELDDGIFLMMRDLTFAEEIDLASKHGDDQAAIFYDMIVKSIKGIYTNEDAWIVGEDISEKDVEEFIAPISSDKSKEIYEFVTNMPYMVTKIIVDGKEMDVTSKDVDFLS